mmetsp:Transcript_36679/g.80400  ORF Transcript_36679/g.80400 Transcript_36679/m.80400 type:complete len:292 (-) Transcript_36679:31-906(-)
MAEVSLPDVAKPGTFAELVARARDIEQACRLIPRKGGPKPQVSDADACDMMAPHGAARLTVSVQGDNLDDMAEEGRETVMDTSASGNVFKQCSCWISKGEPTYSFPISLDGLHHQLRTTAPGGCDMFNHTQRTQRSGSPTYSARRPTFYPGMGHTLHRFVAAHDYYACNQCLARQMRGDILLGCRLCDLDLCVLCVGQLMKTGQPQQPTVYADTLRAELYSAFVALSVERVPLAAPRESVLALLDRAAPQQLTLEARHKWWQLRARLAGRADRGPIDWVFWPDVAAELETL